LEKSFGRWNHGRQNDPTNNKNRNSEELQLFLRMQNIDVMLATETHVRKGQRISLPIYSTYHAIHPVETTEVEPLS